MLSVENKPIMLSGITLIVVSPLICLGKAGAYQSGVPNLTVAIINFYHSLIFKGKAGRLALEWTRAIIG